VAVDTAGDDGTRSVISGIVWADDSAADAIAQRLKI
jgi:hypothetical protein